MIFKSLRLYLVIFLTCISFVLSAQKLPEIQSTSIRTPIDSKVDGKASEWSGKFQSYNSVDRLFYTIANNDTSLYLIVCVPGARTLNKIMNGGITLIISHSLKDIRESTSRDDVSVVFPVMETKRRLLTLDAIEHYFEYAERKSDTTALNKRKIDSTMLVVNQRLVQGFREIQVGGISDITVPTIAVQNKYGIIAMGQFNDQMAFVSELSIPLKYLRLDIRNSKKFRYKIKLTGQFQQNKPISIGSMDNLDDGPKEFWGEYTLSEK